MPGVRVVSDPVHLLPAGEVFRWGYGGSTSVAVCGEVVAGAPDDGEEDPRYCAACVHEALRWCARPMLVGADTPGAGANDR